LSPLKRAIQPAADAPFSIPLGPASFYLDDVKDIHDALIEFSARQASSAVADDGKPPDSNVGLVEIRALNATADEIKDLQDATRAELNHLSLILSSPKIRIDLWSRSAEVIAESDSPSVLSFAGGIASYVTTRKSWVAVWKMLPVGLLLALPIVAALTVGRAVSKSSSLYFKLNQTNAIAGLVYCAFVIANLVLYYRQRRHIVKVRPSWRNESRHLTGQMRRELIIALIGAVVLGLLGFWAGLLVTK
jgi:hypothetical protein